MSCQGDDWKNQPEPPPERLTRAQAQRLADLDYAGRRIGRDAWRRLTDALSYARGDDASRIIAVPASIK